MKKIPDDIESMSFVVTDTETTGLEPPRDELTEIGAIKLNGRKEVGRFSSLIKPKEPISDFITKFTGIDDAMVKNAESSIPVFKRYLDFLGDSILVAHNAEFDLKFLKAEAVKANIDFPDVPVICTLNLSRQLILDAGRYSLGSLCKKFDIEIKARHRAIGDVEGTIKLLWILLDRIKEQGKTLSDFGFTIPEV